MTAQSSTTLKADIGVKKKILSKTHIDIVDTMPIRDADPADAIQVGKGTAGDKTVFFKTDTADASIHYDDVDDRFEFSKSITLGTLVAAFDLAIKFAKTFVGITVENDSAADDAQALIRTVNDVGGVCNISMVSSTWALDPSIANFGNVGAGGLANGLLLGSSKATGKVLFRVGGGVAANDVFRLEPTAAIIEKRFALASLSPTQITSDQNDFDTGNTSYVRLDTDASRTFTGLLAPTEQDFLIIVNVGTNDLILAHQDAGSAAANRIISPTAMNITLAPNDSAILEYDSTTLRWRIIVSSAAAASANGFPTFHFWADQLNDPVTADWAVNDLAPAVADDLNDGLTLRLHDDTTIQGSGNRIITPTGATSMVLTTRSRALTAPPAVRTVGWRIHFREILDNLAVGAWDAGTVLNDIDIPTNAFSQKDTQTLTYATLGLTAGRSYQFQEVRINPAAGTELVGDWGLEELIIGAS